MKTSTLSFLLGLAFTNLATARTDLEGCVSSEVVIDYYASYLWYVPDTGEICSFLDCGGGRAPPKTNQPGCPLYEGTATVTPSYIEGWGPNGKQAASTTTAAVTTTASVQTSSSASTESSEVASASESASGTQTGGTLITAAPTSSPAVSMTTTTSSASSAANSASTSAASPTSTGNAASTHATNVGVMAIMAAAVGAMVM